MYQSQQNAQSPSDSSVNEFTKYFQAKDEHHSILHELISDIEHAVTRMDGGSPKAEVTPSKENEKRLVGDHLLAKLNHQHQQSLEFGQRLRDIRSRLTALI